MRRFLLFSCLFFISLSSYAAWKKVSESDGLLIYVDTGRITKKDDQSKIWTLFDFSTPQKNIAGESYSSLVTLWSYDCNKSAHKILSAVQYSKRMGDGSVINQIPEAKNWEYVVPNTFGETIQKIACK